MLALVRWRKIRHSCGCPGLTGIGWYSEVDERMVVDINIGSFNDLIYLPYLCTIIAFSFITFNYIELPWQKKINKL